ncbi:uncharacterized protein LOC126187370 isoform X1 [Schistocerca cancellata]|uniref:uncharacterized protein LOC126187370 isoform X1 n=1 Tax=Schistocerca cancellata TaxID=274614 RepID=UPI0021189289|nr:uncharacterized protein LOC126187370 isoform X1 [Schistocerca cancellata]
MTLLASLKRRDQQSFVCGDAPSAAYKGRQRRGKQHSLAHRHGLREDCVAANCRLPAGRRRLRPFAARHSGWTQASASPPAEGRAASRRA